MEPSARIRRTIRRHFDKVKLRLSKYYEVSIADPQKYTYFSVLSHVFLGFYFACILWYINIDIFGLVWLSALAFSASGSFVFLLAFVEYAERHHEIHSIQDFKMIGALAWMHYEMDKVMLRPLLAFPPLHRQLAKIPGFHHCSRSALLNLFLKPRDLWSEDSCGWVEDMLIISLDEDCNNIVPLPDLLSLSEYVVDLVQTRALHRREIEELKEHRDGTLSRLTHRLRDLEQNEVDSNRKMDALRAGINWYEQRIVLSDARNKSIRERFISFSRIYHAFVWRRMVDLKAQLSRETQELAVARRSFARLTHDHESLEDNYENALEEKEELLQELADQDDKVYKAQEETAEWQCVSEGVCFSHDKMSREFMLSKANMYETIYCLLSGLCVVWRFSMALKVKSAARARSDREEKLILRRRLVLVEHARAIAARDQATWRSLYQESEAAFKDLVELYAQQRATYLAQSRQLLTGLLILWRYSQILGRELFEARFRMHMCPVSCRQDSPVAPTPPSLQLSRGILPSSDSLESVNESELNPEQLLSIRFSRSNIAYASLSVQCEQLQAELGDVYDDLEDSRQERQTEREKFESELADARKAIEDLRIESKAETDKLLTELEEARRTIETLRTAKDAAERELQNKRDEMVLARVTVQQMRADVEETKRSLENRVIEWCELAAGAGRPMLLSEPRDEGEDEFRNSSEGFPPSERPDDDDDVVLLHRRGSPPMLAERRERPLPLDDEQVVKSVPASPSPIERKRSSESHPSSRSSPLSGPAVADPQSSPAHRSPLSHAVPSALGAFDLPTKPVPVPFRPNIGLYTSTSRYMLPLAQPRPISAEESLTLFSRPRSPGPAIATPPSSDESPAASDRSSSPDPDFYTPALPASEF